jgi:ribonuclease P protein component
VKYTKEMRLVTRGQISNVFRYGRRYQNDMLRIHVLSNRTAKSRIAISVPRKLCGSVERNRWKRLVREVFRLNSERMRAGYDTVVVPLRRPEGLKLGDVARSFLGLYEKVGHISG